MGKLIITLITYITIITKIKKIPILPYIKPHMLSAVGGPQSGHLKSSCLFDKSLFFLSTLIKATINNVALIFKVLEVHLVYIRSDNVCFLPFFL